MKRLIAVDPAPGEVLLRGAASPGPADVPTWRLRHAATRRVGVHLHRRPARKTRAEPEVTMIPDIIGQSTSHFNQRFFLTALLPTSVFAPTTAVVLLISTDRLSTAITWYGDLTPVSQVLTWLAAAAVVWFLASLLASQWSNVIRLYEGYPLVRLFEHVNRTMDRVGAPPALRAPAPGVAAHWRRRDRLRKRRGSGSAEGGQSPQSGVIVGSDVTLYDDYPPRIDRVLPTALGNIIRAAEDYAEDRYGFDVIYLWPRLTVVLPPEYLVDVEKAMIEYQTPLMVSFGSAILACSSALLVTSQIPTLAFVLVFAGSFFVSWLAYRLSFRAAKEYGDLLRTAVDLYRTDLLARWWPELLAIDDDRRRLRTLREFVITGTRPSVASVAAGPPTTASGLIVPESEVGGSASPDEDSEDTDPRDGRRGLRLSRWLALVVIAVSILGALWLNQHRWVLVASDDIDAFGDLANRVEARSIRRGSLSSDVLEAADSKADLRLDTVNESIAVRRISKGTVITRSDVSSQPGRPPGVVINLARSRTEVRALDLRPGSRVLLLRSAPTDLSSGCAAGDVQGDVLDIVEADTANEVGVLLRIDAAEANEQCLGELSRVQVVRAQESGATSGPALSRR